MSFWKSLAPTGGFSSEEPIAARYRHLWEPNSENQFVAFLLGNYQQAKLILKFVTEDPKELRQLSCATRYLDSLDVYLDPRVSALRHGSGR